MLIARLRIKIAQMCSKSCVNLVAALGKIYIKILHFVPKLDSSMVAFQFSFHVTGGPERERELKIVLSYKTDNDKLIKYSARLSKHINTAAFSWASWA